MKILFFPSLDKNGGREENIKPFRCYFGKEIDGNKKRIKHFYLKNKAVSCDCHIAACV